MSVEYQNSILWRGEDPSKQKFKPKYDDSKKIQRYRAGQAPKFAQEEGEGGAASSSMPDLKKDRRRRAAAAAVIVEDAAQTRLKRLQQSSTTESGAERPKRHRTTHEAVVLEEAKAEEEEKVKKEDPKSLARPKEEEPDLERPVASAGVAEVKFEPPPGEEEDLELITRRRERARELALIKRKQEEEVMKEEFEDEVAEDEQDEESEYESEEDEDPRLKARMKPVFVSKSQRETVREKELIQKEEEEALQKAKEKLKERKEETKTLVIDKIREEEEAEKEGKGDDDRSDIELIDDNDEKNEAEEYDLWKIRELKRIKRDAEERIKRQEEIEFILRRRNMTDEERAEDDRRLDAGSSKRDEVKQFNFMQKYYHRGGFFQDKAAAGDEPLYLRDYHEPLEEEKYDKSLLPKAMQLRRGEFGKKGQVKHTHLTDADTTDFSAAWSQHTKQIQRYQEKMAAAKGINQFDRPAGPLKKAT